MMVTILHLAAAVNPWGVPWDSVDRRFGESSDKWMLWMVTLIHLSVAPKALVGSAIPDTSPTNNSCHLHCSDSILHKGRVQT